MHVDAGNAAYVAGITHERNGLALRYLIARRHQELRVVRVQRPKPVAVIDNNVAAIAAVPAASLGDNNPTASGGQNLGANATGQIYSIVTVQTLSSNSTHDRS